MKHLPESNPKHVDKLLIIGPLSSFGPWEHEYQECFGRKVESMRLIGGLSKKKKSLYLHGIDTCELTIASYQSVISIKDDLCFFLSRNKVMVVLDEAHKIKKHSRSNNRCIYYGVGKTCYVPSCPYRYTCLPMAMKTCIICSNLSGQTEILSHIMLHNFLICQPIRMITEYRI